MRGLDMTGASGRGPALIKDQVVTVILNTMGPGLLWQRKSQQVLSLLQPSTLIISMLVSTWVTVGSGGCIGGVPLVYSIGIVCAIAAGVLVRTVSECVQPGLRSKLKFLYILRAVFVWEKGSWSG